MSEPSNSRTRSCRVCGGKIVCSPTIDKTLHNCKSLGKKLLSNLPDKCWELQSKKFGIDLLTTLPAFRQSSIESKFVYQQYVDLAFEVLQKSENGPPDIDYWRTLGSKYNSKVFLRFYKLLPMDSALRSSLKLFTDELTYSTKLSRLLHHESLPPEFSDAVEFYSKASLRLLKVKIERGHDYKLITLTRRISEAIKFCVFLKNKNIEFLHEISQCHIDDYAITHGKSSSSHACVFLKYIRSKFVFPQNFKRPKYINKSPRELVATEMELRMALEKIVSYKFDDTVVVMGLFLVLFAQPLARSCELKFSNIKREDGKLLICFTQKWIALDNLSEKYLCKLFPQMAEENFIGSEQRLFCNNYTKLSSTMREITNICSKKLRLGAIANMIRFGVINRGAIGQIFGVDIHTVEMVERLFPWDLQSTVPEEIIASRNEVIRGERKC